MSVETRALPAYLARDAIEQDLPKTVNAIKTVIYYPHFWRNCEIKRGYKRKKDVDFMIKLKLIARESM
jgi:hypothetical protein